MSDPALLEQVALLVAALAFTFTMSLALAVFGFALADAWATRRAARRRLRRIRR